MSVRVRCTKPANLAHKSFLFRPNRVLTGHFTVAVTLERGNAAANSQNPAVLHWCGSRFLLGHSDSMSSYLSSLRFPDEINPGDVYCLTLSGFVPLNITLSLHGDPALADDDIAVEVVDDYIPTETICSNPATTSQRRWVDHLVIGSAYMPPYQQSARFEIAALRDFPEGAGLRLLFRPIGVPANNQLIRIAVGAMTRLNIIAKGAQSSEAYLWLPPATAGDRWPLTFKGDHPFEWSGSVQRRWDTNFLPAFSLLESDSAAGA